MKFKDIKKVPLNVALGNITYPAIFSHDLQKLPQPLLLQFLNCLLASKSERSAWHIRLLNKRFKPKDKKYALYALRNYNLLSPDCRPVLVSMVADDLDLKTIKQDPCEPASNENYALPA